MATRSDRRNAIGRLTDEYLGLWDAGATLASSLFAEPISGYAGILGSILPGEEGQGARWVDEVQDALTWEPKTGEGRRNLGRLREGVEAALNYQPLLRDQSVGEELQMVGDWWREGAVPALQGTFGEEVGSGIGAGTVGVLSAVGLPGRAGGVKTIKNLDFDDIYPARPNVVGPAKVEPNSDAIEELFGTKTAREQDIAGAVEDLAEIEGAGGKSVAIPPDYYRQMYRDQGIDAVMDDVRAGKHLRESPSGGLIGTPRHVQDMEGVEQMRGRLDEQLDLSAAALAEAERQGGDLSRIGTWYPRAKEFNWLINEPYQLPRWLEGVGTYSAGVAPESELAFNLKHWNSRALGEPVMAYRGAPMRNLDEAVQEYRPAELGFKIGEYAKKNDPRIVGDPSPFGVNDFRMAQTFGYTDPQGNPWKAGAGPTMHPVMDAETALMVDRANEIELAGKTDWTGETAQEIPWVGGKAQDIYGRGKRGKFAGPGGKAAALREANNTAADYAYKHAMTGTYESTPGAGVGHRGDILAAPYEGRLAYHQEAPWTTTDINRPDVPYDVLYSALGFRQLPTKDAPGMYRNTLGEVEFNPASGARPLVDFRTVETPSKVKREREKQRREGRLTPSVPAEMTSRAVDVAENFRGLVDAQEAYAANLPITTKSRQNKNDILIDLAGETPTQEQMRQLGRLTEGTPFDPSATSRGVLAMNFKEGPKTRGKWKKQAADAKAQRKAAKAFLEENEEAIKEIFPSAKIVPAAREGVYVKALGPEQYTGQYTMQVLEKMAKLPENAWRNLAESEGVRSAVRAKLERDRGHPLTRKDLQETRRFFAEEAWQDVVALIRKGMTPKAALAALGFSAGAMAEDED